MTGKELRIHTSERTLDGRCAPWPSSVASIASKFALDLQDHRTHGRIDRQNLARLVPLNAGSRHARRRVDTV